MSSAMAGLVERNSTPGIQTARGLVKCLALYVPADTRKKSRFSFRGEPPRCVRIMAPKAAQKALREEIAQRPPTTEDGRMSPADGSIHAQSSATMTGRTCSAWPSIAMHPRY
jgi:hypothetical protein